MTIDNIKQCQIEEVKGVGAKEVADGQIRGADQGNGAYPGEEFRQGGNQGEEDNSYPDPPQAGPEGDNITVFGYRSP